MRLVDEQGNQLDRVYVALTDSEAEQLRDFLEQLVEEPGFHARRSYGARRRVCLWFWEGANFPPLGLREVDDEDGTLGIAGLDPDLAVHAADEFTADIEPETGAADAARQFGVEAVELLEDPLTLARRDADA